MAAPGGRVRGAGVTIEAENPVMGLQAKADTEPAISPRPETTAERTPVGTVDARSFEGNAREPDKIVDKLPWWLNRVQQGQMTAAEAEVAYGKQTGAGRPRAYKTFGD